MTENDVTRDLYGFSYDERNNLMPELTEAFAAAGGWMLERKAVTASSMQFRFEIQRRAVLELYGRLMETGIELTRASHGLLTELCTCERYQGGCAAGVLTLSLELSFLEDVTLHSLLTSGCAAA